MPLKSQVAQILTILFRRRSRQMTMQSSQSDEVREALRLLEEYGRPSAPRMPTDEEVIVAAWANLAIEEKDLTLDEARRFLVAH